MEYISLTFILACPLLVCFLTQVEQLLGEEHHEVQQLIKELVEVVDRGLLLGVALPPPAPSLTEIASILNAALFLGSSPFE